MNTGGLQSMPQPGGWGGMGGMNFNPQGLQGALQGALAQGQQGQGLMNRQPPNPFANGGIPPMMPTQNRFQAPPMPMPQQPGGPQFSALQSPQGFNPMNRFSSPYNPGTAQPMNQQQPQQQQPMRMMPGGAFLPAGMRQF